MFYERRLEAGERLKKAPMGYYSKKTLGEIQMALTTDMNALESSAMPVVENILGSLIYAAICTLILLLFNWKIGLVTLVGLVVGMILLQAVQRGAEKAVPIRFHAQGEMTERILEFIQGNMVMRLFGTEHDGLNRVKDAFNKKQKADIHLENSAIWPINLYKYIFRLASCGVVLVGGLTICKTGNVVSNLCDVSFFGILGIFADGRSCGQYSFTANCGYLSWTS